MNRISTLLYKGLLNDMEMFVFTDNWVFEIILYKITSNIPLLFNTVIQLHEIQM